MDAFLKGASAKPKDTQPSGSGAVTSTKESYKRRTQQPWVEK